MKALVLEQSGRPARMSIQERPRPRAKPGYSLVRMHAATINPLSNLIRSGVYENIPLPRVLSNDGSGVIEESDRYAKDTPVAIYGGGQLGITEDGLQQQWVLVEDRRIVALPSNLSLDEGAALPINYVTAYQALTRVGEVQPGETLLISGASGSLGQALIQTARALGAVPIGIVSSSNKVETAVQAGAAQVIDLSREDLQPSVKQITQGAGVDKAFDAVAGGLLSQLLLSVRTRGTVVSIGFAGGPASSVDIIDLVVYEKRLLGYDAHLETDEDVNTALNAIQGFVSAGTLRPCIDSSFSLERFEEAYARLESREARGTILLHL